MTTSVQRNLPPGYVETFGEDFTAGFSGAVDDDGNPLYDIATKDWYSDPADYMGGEDNSWYTAGIDDLTSC